MEDKAWCGPDSPIGAGARKTVKPSLTKASVTLKAIRMKWIFSRHIPDALGVAVSVFAVYLLSYFAVWAAVSPVQLKVFPSLTPIASLLFLPHGVRVLATSVLSGRAVPGIAAAEFAACYLFWGLTDPLTLVLLSTASGGVTWLTFEGLRRLGIDAFYLKAAAEPPPLRTLLLAAIAAAIASAFLLTSILEGHIPREHVTVVLAAFVTGDVTGFLAVILIAKSIFPLLTGKAD